MNFYFISGRTGGLKTIGILVFLFFINGCAISQAPFASKDFRGGKLAILPFDNLSGAPGAAKTLENFILIEFLKIPSLPVFEPGQVGEAMSRQRVRLATNIPHDTVLKIGADLGADLLMIGVVHDYQMQRLSGAGGAGETPVVAVSLRILDAKTGAIVWATNAIHSGNDSESLFGIGRIRSLNNLAAVLAAEIANNCRESLIGTVSR